jgi:23S rRNA (cytosine1962-C5)-methyltransferase
MNCIPNILSSLLRPSSNEVAERLFHGRGHLVKGAEGVAIDWFAGHLLFTLYQELADPELKILTDAVCNQLSEWEFLPQSTLCQRRYLKGAPVLQLSGELNQPIWVQENGLRFRVNLLDHQNHGLFLDMAAGRRWVKEHAQGRAVLNLFSYTCGFSVAALAGGATSVINLDMSKGALSVGRQNHAENGLKGAKFLDHDLFNSWGKLKRLGPYQMIIVDPPSFQGSSFTLERHYPKVIRRLASLSTPDADLLLCLNAPEKGTEFLLELVAKEAPELSFQSRLENPAAFADKDPERALKVLHFRLLPKNVGATC